jgi:hypothetical protein
LSWAQIVFDYQTLKRTAFIPALVAAGFLLLAAFSHWPYAFYILLRVTVCAIGLYLAHNSFVAGRTLWVWIFGAVAVLFNPLVPMRMHRSDWSIVNIIAASIFIAWLAASVVRGRNRRR